MNDLLNPSNPTSPLNPFNPIWQSNNNGDPQQETLARIGEYDYSNSCTSAFLLAVIMFIVLCGFLVMIAKKD